MSELSDRVRRIPPPFPEPLDTQGPNGSFAQLHADLYSLREALKRGGDYNTLEHSQRQRLVTQFPCYVWCATLQRITTAALQEAGIVERFAAWGWWQRTYGDPWLEGVRKLEWFTHATGVRL